MKFFVYFFLLLIKIILSKKNCIESEKYCAKCNLLTDLCAICERKDILIPDNNGGCKGAKKCLPGMNYCNECNQDGDLCKICEDGYFPDDNGCCSYTNNCKLSFNGECFECENDYILIGQKKNSKRCKSLLSEDFKNCEKIDIENGTCEKCEENYFLTEGDKKCTKTDNCYNSIFGNCILCNEGFYLNKRKELCENKTDTIFSLCKQTLDGEKCDICDDGTYFDENGICTYSNFCAESSDGYCRKCIFGYYLSRNYYCSNIKNCYNFDIDTGVCLSCIKYYYLDNKDYKCNVLYLNIYYLFPNDNSQNIKYIFQIQILHNF